MKRKKDGVKYSKRKRERCRGVRVGGQLVKKERKKETEKESANTKGKPMDWN